MCLRRTGPQLLPNACYRRAFCLSLLCCTFFTAVLVRWLSRSFGLFIVGLWVAKNTNLPPNTLANYSLLNGSVTLFIWVIFILNQMTLELLKSQVKYKYTQRILVKLCCYSLKVDKLQFPGFL